MTKNAIVEKKEALPPAELMNSMIGDAETGKEFDNVSAVDVAIPFIYILQSNSPQVTRGERQVEGAVEGDFYNMVTGEVLKGGIQLIPCGFKKSWVEWVPREGGGGSYQGEHLDEKIVDETTKNDKGKLILKNGNEIVPTSYFYCLLLNKNGGSARCVLSFSSTQMKRSRRWMSAIMTLQIKKKDGSLVRPPMYSHIYQANTVGETNSFGSWSSWQIGGAQIITDAQLYKNARAFSEDCGKGTVKLQTPPREGQQGGDGGTAQASADKNTI